MVIGENYRGNSEEAFSRQPKPARDFWGLPEPGIAKNPLAGLRRLRSRATHSQGNFTLTLVMDYLCLVIHYFNQLHHATVFMSQNVAVVHVLAGKIGKVGTHFEISRSHLAA